MDGRIDIGADILGSNGDKLGTVSYLVVHPPEMHISDVVVSTGEILGRDIVVPLTSVSRVKDGKVVLSIDRNDLQSLPDYVEVEYQQPPAGWVPPPELYYPATGLLWPIGTYFPEVASVKVNTPAGTVGISEGMDVESSDGHKVGALHSLEADPESNEVTNFVIKRGFLFGHDTQLPARHAAAVHEGKIVLDLTKDEVQELEGQTGKM